MNKRDYVNKLLALCTEGQKNIFNRMYPEGVNIKQLDWATTQLENTLKDLNEQKSEMRELKKQHETEVSELTNKTIEANKKLSSLEEDLIEADLMIERLKNPINTENAKIQEDLDFLSALQSAGVDNWDGYDYAIEIMKEG